MSALPKRISLEEFVAWEERQDLRHEYDGVGVEAMTGGSSAHARIQANVVAELHSRLRGGPGFVVSGDLKIKTMASVRYPDAMVICAKTPSNATATSEPVVVFEILSPSTARKDLGAKNVEYQTLESLRRYVVLHQTAIAAEVFYRDDDGEWAHEFVAAAGALRLPEIEIEISISNFYDGIEGLDPVSLTGPPN